MSGLFLPQGDIIAPKSNGKHRYWRIKALTKNSSSYTECGAMMILRQEDGTFIDMTSVPWASSPYEGSYPASNMFNTNPWSYQQWGNQSISNMWIRWDFGAGTEIDIGSVSLTHTHAFTNRNPINWDWQWSDNDADWTTVIAARDVHFSRGYGKRWNAIGSYHPSLMRFWRLATWHENTSYPRIGAEWRWKIGGVTQNTFTTPTYGQADESSGYNKTRLSDGNLTNVHQYDVRYAPCEGGLDFGVHTPIEELWLKATPSYQSRCPLSLWVEWSEDEAMWNRAKYDNSGYWGAGAERNWTWDNSQFFN